MQISLSLVGVNQGMVSILCRKTYPQDPAMPGVVSQCGKHCPSQAHAAKTGNAPCPLQVQIKMLASIVQKENMSKSESSW